jgi:hypothetical protein
MTTQPCVSPSTGTISPDVRVFYQYGMVLGLNDFLQEQTHNLELDYRHERALHGYGTVYGLHVTTTPPDADNDVIVTVEPGMAVDQWGREVTVPSAQCARLGAWLAAREEATSGTIAAHLGISGELVVYVVAAYAECSDDLVPLPGQPCSTSAQLQVPSRLRDVWDIELRLTPPAMPAWDVIRQLAGLLNSIQVVPGLDPSQSSEEAIITAVLNLPTPQTLSDSPSGPVTYQLPAATADDAFDRILTAWVTQVRPNLAPDLTAPDPAWDPAILLSTITVTPEMPFSTANPVILWCSDPDDTGRPYLLQTELMQELRLGESADPEPTPLVQQAVTLAGTADASGWPSTLTAWFHLGQPVSLPATIQVVNQNGQSDQFNTAAASGTSFSEVWTLSAPDSFVVANGDQLAATFHGAQVMVGDNNTTLAMAVAGLGLLDTTGTGDVTAYTTVLLPLTPPPPPPIVPFVTVSYIAASSTGPYLELWFDMEPSGRSEDVVMTSPDVTVVDDITGAVYWSADMGTPTQQAQNIWTIPASTIEPPAHLRLIFDTELTMVNVPPSAGDMTLAGWMNYRGIRYLGWDGGTWIATFVRVGTSGG